MKYLDIQGNIYLYAILGAFAVIILLSVFGLLARIFMDERNDEELEDSFGDEDNAKFKK